MRKLFMYQKDNMCVSTRYSPLTGTVFSQRKQEKNISRVDNQKENNISKEGLSMIQENEIPKHFKSTESNISKSNRKSKHKHHYEECLIQNKWNFKSNAFTQEEKECIHTSLSSYCTICGKIGGIIKNSKYQKEIKALQKQRQTRNNFWESISGEKIYEMYHDKLPVFFVEDIYKEKYIDLE